MDNIEILAETTNGNCKGCILKYGNDVKYTTFSVKCPICEEQSWIYENKCPFHVKWIIKYAISSCRHCFINQMIK